jgi:hypothetical protein
MLCPIGVTRPFESTAGLELTREGRRRDGVFGLRLNTHPQNSRVGHPALNLEVALANALEGEEQH